MGLVFSLLALWAVPVMTLLWARRRAPKKVWRLTGISLGLIVAPASSDRRVSLDFLVLWRHCWVSSGSPLAMFHGEPGV